MTQAQPEPPTWEAYPAEPEAEPLRSGQALVPYVAPRQGRPDAVTFA